MRFCLTLELEKNTFPLEYRRVVLSYIKNALSKCSDGKYLDKFFNNTIQKDYCFTVILPKAKFENNKIVLEDKRIKINFSTVDKDKTGLILFGAFIAQKNKPYPLEDHNFMTLKSITNQNREEINNSRAIFKTSLGSGLCIRDHQRDGNKDMYYVFSDEEFREKMKKVLTNQIMKAGFSEIEADMITINPIQCKKVVAKHYSRYIDITTGVIEIQADSEILQYFYDAGIGSRKSAGFGMIDLLTQDLL